MIASLLSFQPRPVINDFRPIPKYHNRVLGTYYQIRAAILEEYGPHMLAIAICESNLDQKAYNPKDPFGGSHGIFQENGAWIPKARAMGYDIVNRIEDNFAFAKVILKSQGEKAWGCSRKV